jgi:excisionase family DNA binding protein
MVSPKQLATALGVSESSLKRWADGGQIDAVRTAGGHRRIPLHEAVRFIRHMGLPVLHAQALGLAEQSLDLPDWRDRPGVCDAFHLAIEAGRAADALLILQSCYLAGWSVSAIADGPIREVLSRVGQLWQHAEWGIIVEHRATDICLQGLNMLRTFLPPRRGGAPVALGGAGGEDPYILPSLVAAVALADCGFNEINLGPLTPGRVLANAIAHYSPAIVWFSLSKAPKAEEVLAELALIRDAAEKAGAEVVAGGRAFAELPPIQMPGVHIAHSMAEIEALARARFQHLLSDHNLPNG